MNYFIGSLYGCYDDYQTIKQTLHLKPIDHLWILGDVLDTIEASPESSLEIIYDIMKTPNIHLIIGDHEFLHIMKYLEDSNEEMYELWCNLLYNLPISGEPLAEYLEQNPEEADHIFPYLINHCEVSQILQIGNRFFYLCHGFPSPYQKNFTQWQFLTTTGTIVPDYVPIVKSDISIEMNKSSFTYQNCFVICSHQDIEEVSDSCTEVYHKNGVFLLGKHIPGVSIPVLAIDAAGYFVKNIAL